ncbi:hypothetical protein LNQ82_02850 [Conchiformibius steedae DSM 2580]|uniref:Uncharacterized protein n=1 Tax=Conchiformibius steedae DSM 2580 TaxID=1121352 RepID=A0AAE9HV09_9NEIS|nr:hypothetical protein [Conchiformibius steedae]QMT33464.1 hypothetical protein H3L98_10375 [Conchiformibius steedae]URD68119.1 hypothetical protein LNQ82_02850 [Conchiformibius steedae DSM 2580]
MIGKIPLTVEWAFGILISFLIALLWHFINDLKRRFADAEHDRTRLREQLHQVEKNYQSKAEAREQRGEIAELLREIKANVKEVSEKLDRKADK